MAWLSFPANNLIQGENSLKIWAEDDLGGIIFKAKCFASSEAAGIKAAASAIQAEQTARVTEDEALATSIDTLFAFIDTNDNEAAIQIEREARVSEDEALAREATSMETRFGESHAALSQEIETRTGPDSALATSIDTLFAFIDTNDNEAAIQIEREARVSEDEALAREATSMETRFGESHAALSQEIETRTGPDSALATSIDTLTSTVGANTAAIQTEQEARATAISAEAARITTLQSKLGDNFSSVQTVSKAIDGIEASHTIKVQADSNGKLVMAGIGLIADSVTQQSEIMMMANQFQIVIPGSVPTQPFIIKNIDGVDIVGISGNLVIDGKILGKHIEANSITAAHLSSTEIFTMKLAVGPGSSGFGNFIEAPAILQDIAEGASFTSTTWANTLIGKAKLDSTIIVGGCIETSLIKTDAIVIGDLSGASTVINNASTGAAAATTVNSWKYLNTTYIDGGNIYTNSITANSIAAGTITAQSAILANASVETITIAGQAVTIPIGAFTKAEIAGIADQETLVQSATIISTGAPIFITFSMQTDIQSRYFFDFKRNAETIYVDYTQGIGSLSLVMVIQDTPGIGSITYTATFRPVDITLNASYRSLTLLEVKR